MTAEKHPCAGRIHGDYSVYACSRNGTREEDGQWWCHQHAPSALAAKEARHEEEYRAKRDRDVAIHSRAKALATRADAPLMTAAYHWTTNRWDDSAVVIPLEDLERLLKEAGR